MVYFVFLWQKELWLLPLLFYFCSQLVEYYENTIAIIANYKCILTLG